MTLIFHNQDTIYHRDGTTYLDAEIFSLRVIVLIISHILIMHYYAHDFSYSHYADKNPPPVPQSVCPCIKMSFKIILFVYDFPF